MRFLCARPALRACACAALIALAGFAPAPSSAQENVQPSIEVAPDLTPLAPAPDLGRGPPPEPDASTVRGDNVVLRGLDKLTGKVDTVEARVGAFVMYERLRIDVKVCYSRTQARAPEASVFLQIFDTKNDPATLAFSGWMFASSPALSAMDHPRYDVWVLSCSTT